MEKNSVTPKPETSFGNSTWQRGGTFGNALESGCKEGVKLSLFAWQGRVMLGRTPQRM